MTTRTKTPEYRREQYYANLERERARRRDYQKKRRAADPAGARARATAAYKRNPWPSRRCAWRSQGIDVAVAEAKLRAHNGRCDCCGSTVPGGGGWQVDHDHSTGEIRGILCMLCNHALGRIERIGLYYFERYLTGRDGFTDAGPVDNEQ